MFDECLTLFSPLFPPFSSSLSSCFHFHSSPLLLVFLPFPPCRLFAYFFFSFFFRSCCFPADRKHSPTCPCSDIRGYRATIYTQSIHLSCVDGNIKSFWLNDDSVAFYSCVSFYSLSSLLDTSDSCLTDIFVTLNDGHTLKDAPGCLLGLLQAAGEGVADYVSSD